MSRRPLFVRSCRGPDIRLGGEFDFQPVRLPSPTSGFFGGDLVRQQQAGGGDGTFRQPAGSGAQLLALLDFGDVALHIFRRPTARVGDEWELRQVKSKFREKSQQLAGDSLDVVLPAVMMKPATFRRMITRSLMVTWF